MKLIKQSTAALNHSTWVIWIPQF